MLVAVYNLLFCICQNKTYFDNGKGMVRCNVRMELFWVVGVLVLHPFFSTCTPFAYRLGCNILRLSAYIQIYRHMSHIPNYSDI